MITVTSHYVVPLDATGPGLAIQLTKLVDSYMVWVGVTENSPEQVHRAPAAGNLAKDWACAMGGSQVGGLSSSMDLQVYEPERWRRPCSGRIQTWRCLWLSG